jgi:hypothetical protein
MLDFTLQEPHPVLGIMSNSTVDNAAGEARPARLERLLPRNLIIAMVLSSLVGALPLYMFKKMVYDGHFAVLVIVLCSLPWLYWCFAAKRMFLVAEPECCLSRWHIYAFCISVSVFAETAIVLMYCFMAISSEFLVAHRSDIVVIAVLPAVSLLLGAFGSQGIALCISTHLRGTILQVTSAFAIAAGVMVPLITIALFREASAVIWFPARAVGYMLLFAGLHMMNCAIRIKLQDPLREAVAAS